MFHDISKILPKSIQRAGISKRVGAVTVIEAFSTIIGDFLSPELAKKVRPLFVRDKVLTIASLSSIASQEVKLKEAELIAKINEKIGKTAVEKIRYSA